jgi:CheY-like chemotaxis protein
MSKILVVEDTPDARELIKSVLELEGFEVVFAADGIEGIERARAEAPDLIITDIAMPRLNGIDMIRRLRSSPESNRVPILAVTSHRMEMAIEAIRAGANRALARPVQNYLLLSFISDLLGRQ